MISSKTRDGEADRGVTGGDKERTSPEPKMVRLAAVAPVKARKKT
jgi:hypothetical protein